MEAVVTIIGAGVGSEFWWTSGLSQWQVCAYGFSFTSHSGILRVASLAEEESPPWPIRGPIPRLWFCVFRELAPFKGLLSPFEVLGTTAVVGTGEGSAWSL